ncbi:hydantoinase/oxoprolinase family protein [Kineosporia babensis]|uniref:Hydantoinase/oxoprolinase family protein n=1 Tax=Kineosporia babensis TaxID=499548 RepID=A0A9X1SZB6_9ACTN|nr:hydantoinase/oxoprolinase family protein [Kineosporia babensis]MCD5311833.1 hydantoinase/oxoprolinase family protein [Kineosporia babensis]
MTESQAAGWRIGIDVGGTFTDLIAVQTTAGGCRPAESVRHKTPSVPSDPAAAVEQGLRELLERGIAAQDVLAVTHGTTIGLNAILQGRGARVALLTSAGHRDILQIGRARLPRSFDLHAVPPRAAVPRDRVVELEARFTPSGEAVSGVDDYARALAELQQARPDAVALSLIGAYTSPAAEGDLAERLTADLGVPVTSAATLWPEAGEYERTALAVLDAQIAPLMQGYLSRLEAALQRIGLTAPLYITTSNGGSVSLSSAARRPIDTVLSGPAAGVGAASRLWPGLDMVTIDMGGTSSDIGVLVGGKPALTTTASVGDHPLVTPVVEVTAIGAGGGSVVWADLDGAHPTPRVGPSSAGADPGPAAYGRGGDQPTITDAYVHTGIIDPDAFLGGAMPLSRELADAALTRVQQALDPAAGPEAATKTSDNALTLATVGMASRLRTVLARHGEVPDRFTFVAFGGAGGSHAALLADEVGAERIIVPAAAATFCALGAAITPVRRDFVRTARLALDADSLPELTDVTHQLTDEALTWFQKEGAGARGSLVLSADLKYAGQPSTLTVPLTTGGLQSALSIDLEAGLAAFAESHRRHYGFVDPAAEVLIETVRLTLTAEDLSIEDAGGTLGLQKLGRRRLRTSQAWSEADVLAVVTDPEAPAELNGPAVVERADTSVLVPPGWQVRVDTAGNLHLNRLPKKED